MLHVTKILPAKVVLEDKTLKILLSNGQGGSGASAYQVAVNNGYIGTQSEWLASLQGEQGIQGQQGEQGIQGVQGLQGEQGEQGLQGESAYQSYLNTTTDNPPLSEGEWSAKYTRWNTDYEVTEIKIDGSWIPAGYSCTTFIADENISHGQPIYVSDSAGASGKIKCSKYINDGSIAYQYYVGVNYGEVTTGNIGVVITGMAVLRSINTNAFNENDILYLSETVAGGYQNTAPTTGVNVPVAFVIRKASNGVISVRWQSVEYTETTVNLSSGGWSSNTQTETITGLTSSSDVLVYPPSDRTAFLAFGNAQISATAIGLNSITFTCTTTPTTDINNVIIRWK